MKQITFKYQEDCVIQQPRCQAIAALLGQMLHGPGAEWTKTCKSYIGASKKYASETCDCICDYLPYNVHSKRFIALYTMILSCLSLKLSSSLSTWYLASALQGWSRSGILYLQSSIVLKRLEDSDIKSLCPDAVCISNSLCLICSSDFSKSGDDIITFWLDLYYFY